MKRIVQHRHQQTKHSGTYSFAPGNVIVAPPEVVTDKMPAYNSQGREYRRVLPPLRDKRDIDLNILSEVLNDVCPGLDISRLSITDHIATWDKSLKFRYSNLTDLLWILRAEKKIDCSTFLINAIDHRYNSKFQTDKQKEVNR